MRLLLTLTLLAAPLAAQQSAPPPQANPRERGLLGRQGPTIVATPLALALAGFDADQDARVSRAEAAAGAGRSFAAIANGAADFGYIGFSQWSLRTLGDANAAPGPYAVDADRNDRISAAEIAATLLGEFDRLDRDRDGALTRAELLTVGATAYGDDPRGRGGKRPPRQ